VDNVVGSIAPVQRRGDAKVTPDCAAEVYKHNYEGDFFVGGHGCDWWVLVIMRVLLFACPLCGKTNEVERVARLAGLETRERVYGKGMNKREKKLKRKRGLEHSIK
jgi:predicted RNA-binding Zn-ribbon protein involved in translation (DUF1610 family)